MLAFAGLALLCALYFVHLGADFPDVARWNDWARFTDEGWYSSAAVQHVLNGHWIFPGGFNAAAALPVWPVLLRAWFTLTGPGMVPARTLAVLLFGVSLLLLYRLLRRSCPEPVALAAIALLLLSPYSYAFARMAVLEPLVIALFLLALNVCTLRVSPLARGIAVGVLLCLMTLTKTTAVTVAPALLLFLRDEASPLVPLGRTLRQPRSLLPPVIAVAVAAALGAMYFVMAVRPHHLADFRNIFAINRGHAHLSILPRTLATAVVDLRFIDPVVAALAVVAVLLSLGPLRTLWRQPLFRAATLALSGYVFYIGWHAWRSPRYYAPCTVLLATVLALAVTHLPSRIARCAPVLFAIIAAVMAVQTARYVLHPAYTFRDAAFSIAAHMRADTSVPPVLSSPSSDDLVLYSGMRAWNPTWPTGPLDTLLENNATGWYAAWQPQEATLPAAITSRFHPQEVQRYRIMPDAEHQYLVLYRLILR